MQRRPRRWSLRSRSSRAAGSPSTGEPSEAGQLLKDRKAIFQAALEEELRRREIATQLQREGGINAKDLRAQASALDGTLWLPAEADQQLAEALDEELRRLQRRLQIPALRAVHELIAYPYLQVVMAITGLLLVVSSFGAKLLRASGASGWSRILFFSGVSMLVFALVDCIARYVRTRAGGAAGPPIWPLLASLTGLGAAAFGVVQANRLAAQYYTAAQLAFWVVLVVDGAVIAARIYGRVAASRARPRFEEFDYGRRPRTGRSGGAGVG